MKKICVFLMMVSTYASAQQQKDFKWRADNSGGIIITAYVGTSRDVVIPTDIDGMSITSIGDTAFINKNLNNVTIPNCVTLIGKGTFAYNQLTTIIIPDGVTHIGESAFAMNGLTNITLPNSLVTIEGGAFALNKLESVIIPNNVTTIGKVAFHSNRLVNVVLPNSITSIEGSAFDNNLLTSVTIPNNVIYIGEFAFNDNSITSIVIPNSVTKIGRLAFARNPLTSITIGANVNLENDNNERFIDDINKDYSVFGYDSGFDESYVISGSLAGTYTRLNTESTTWIRN